MLIALLSTLAIANPIPGYPTVEPTPPPTVELYDTLDPDAVRAIEQGMTRWLATTNGAPAVELVRVAVEPARPFARWENVMVLEGTVASEARASQVLAHARRTDGVDVVESNLVIASGTERAMPDARAPSPAPTSERALANEVRAALLESDFVSARSIDVDVDETGRIELSGVVDTVEERATAERIARQTADRPVDVDLLVRN
jgi:hypothetical protein